MSESIQSATVAIIGAGPAGLFAARELACKGVNVVLFNRDIKPGGLAEYGIFPDKLRLKDGLRAQFHDILSQPNIHYFGNVRIGENQSLGVKDLREMGFAAILVTCGAQGTKWLGLPGEDSRGVYHAKVVVYHYNHLPPFSTEPLQIGKHVTVIGVGNVMADIVRYLISLPQVEEITTVARRGLGEVKFEKKELEPIISHLDVNEFHREVERITPAMQAICQVPSDEAEMIETAYAAANEKPLTPTWHMHFLYSPVKIVSDASGSTCAIHLEENVLELRNGDVKAKGTGKFIEQPADSVIFAIGDCVSKDLGLPLQGNEFAKNPAPKFPIEGVSYEILDADHPENEKGIFVGGWSRNASSGLVGLARKDGAYAARAVLAYLQSLPEIKPLPVDKVEKQLTLSGYSPVTPAALQLLEEAEKEQAALRGLPEYKFDSNEAMLQVMKIAS